MITVVFSTHGCCHCFTASLKRYCWVMQMCLKIHTHTLLCTKPKAWVAKFVQSLGEQVRCCVKSDIPRLLLFLFFLLLFLLLQLQSPRADKAWWLMATRLTKTVPTVSGPIFKWHSCLMLKGFYLTNKKQKKGTCQRFKMSFCITGKPANTVSMKNDNRSTVDRLPLFVLLRKQWKVELIITAAPLHSCIIAIFPTS